MGGMPPVVTGAWAVALLGLAVACGSEDGPAAADSGVGASPTLPGTVGTPSSDPTLPGTVGTSPSEPLCSPDDAVGIYQPAAYGYETCVADETLEEACARGFGLLSRGPCPTFGEAVRESGWLDGPPDTTWASYVKVEQCTWADGAVRDRLQESEVFATDAGAGTTLLFENGRLVGAQAWLAGFVTPWCCSGSPVFRIVHGEDLGWPVACVSYDIEDF